jgi:hypothetical protein
MEFDSLNPYQSLVPVVADSPGQLVDMLKSIRTPIKIVAIVGYGTKQVAYIAGDVRVAEKPAKIKNTKIKE